MDVRLRGVQTEILVRVHRRVVDADFVVQVRPGGASAEPDVADDVAALHALARGNVEAREMSVTRRDAVWMVDHDQSPVAVLQVGELDHAVCGRDDRMSVRARDIYAGVERALTVERVSALTEGTGDGTFDRPQVRRGGEPQPVGGGGVALAKLDAERGSAAHRGGAQRVELVDGRGELLIAKLAVDLEHGVGLQAVERGDLARQRTERRSLDFVLLRD